MSRLSSYLVTAILAALPSGARAEPEVLPGDPVFPAERVHLAPHLHLGFGLPPGALGLSLESRYGPVGLEVGGGVGFGGPQLMVQAWGHLFPVDSQLSLAIGVGWSVGDVQSSSDLGGSFGPDDRYRPAHWLNLVVAPTLKPMEGGVGALVRFEVGTMFNLVANHEDDTRLLLIFGVTFGWLFAL